MVGLGALTYAVTRGDADSDDEVAESSSDTAQEATEETADEPGTSTTEETGDDDTAADSPTVSEVATSTVMVLLYDSSGTPVCAGSGTIVDADGTILTNAHVLDPSGGCEHERIVIAVTDSADAPPEPLYEADFLVWDAELDLAVIRIARDLDGADVSDTFRPVPLGDSDEVEIGDTIRILGYPSIGGETITFTTGTVSGFTAQTGIGNRSWIKTDATITGGSSGGTAVNDAGNLIGIPTQGGSGGDGPVVDCRVLTDTNGDGFVDANDQCVPFGGFLNGLRPVNLAKDLLAQAGTATPSPVAVPGQDDVAPVAPSNFDLTDLRFTNPGFTTVVPEAGVTPEFVVTASSADSELCFWFDWSGMADGLVWDAVWFVDGEAAEEVSFIGELWEEGPSGQDFWLCATYEVGLQPGLHEMAFYVEGEFTFAEGIEVTPSPVPVRTIEFQNLTGQQVCYLMVNPAGSADYGLDVLGEEEVFVEGASRTVNLPDGQFDVFGFNCDSELIASLWLFTVDGDGTAELIN